MRCSLPSLISKLLKVDNLVDQSMYIHYTDTLNNVSTVLCIPTTSPSIQISPFLYIYKNPLDNFNKYVSLSLFSSLKLLYIFMQFHMIVDSVLDLDFGFNCLENLLKREDIAFILREVIYARYIDLFGTLTHTYNSSVVQH